MTALIRFENIQKGFKNRIILNDLNFEIQKGEIFGIIGMSGSGKTTLLNTIIGFLEPEQGEISFYSEKHKKFESLSKHQREIRKKLGFSTQAASFYPKMTVEENLLHFASLYGLSKKTRVNNTTHLLKLTGLEDAKDRLAQNLSGGMEKKLSIACSLVHNPEVLLLDEPTADLDPISRNETWNLINGINKLGTTMIVASHFLNELEVMCDRIAILYKGKIVAIGSPDDLRSQYFKDDEIILTSNPGKYDTIISELKKYSSLDISQLKKIAKGVSLHTSKSEKIILILLRILRKHNEKIVSLDVKKPSLGHIFESLRNK